MNKRVGTTTTTTTTPGSSGAGNPADGRLHALEGHAIKTEGRLDRIDDTLRAHGAQMGQLDGKMDQIITAVTRSEASQREPFDIHAWVRTVGVLFTCASILAGLALWFVITVTAADTKVQAKETERIAETTKMADLHLRELYDLRLNSLRDRLREMEGKFNWRPSLESRP